MSKLTDQIDAFDQKLRSVDGTKRTATDNAVTQLSRFLLELSQRVDRMADEDVEMSVSKPDDERQLTVVQYTRGGVRFDYRGLVAGTRYRTNFVRIRLR